jgi:hypothetical protein
VDAAGDLLVGIYANESVVELPAGGAEPISIFNSNAAESGPSVAFDLTGNIFLTVNQNGQLLEYPQTQAPSLTYATTPIGSTSSDSPKAVAVRNIGNAPLTMSNIGIPNDFAQAAGSGTPADCNVSTSLTAGAACNLSISFTPSDFGQLQASAVLSDNSANGAPATQSIALSGNSIYTQTITFTGLPATVTYDALTPYALNATSTSGLPITYMVSGPASITGSTLTVYATGYVTVTASQGGNSSYAPAASVSQTIQVNPASQTITFTLPFSAPYGTPITLNGVASSGLPIRYVVQGQGSISGNVLSFTGTGEVFVTAFQDGNGNYSQAQQLVQILNVLAASQTITFTGLPSSATYGSAGPYTLAASSTSGLPITYSLAQGANIAALSGANGNILTITGAGAVLVAANQNGNGNYNAANTVCQEILVNPASQSIAFPSIPATGVYGAAGPYALLATATSGLPVSYSVTGPATVVGTSLNITGSGTVVVTAAQAGNQNISAATSVSHTIVISQATPVVALTAPMTTTTIAAPVNFTATLAGPGPFTSGTVRIYSDGVATTSFANVTSSKVSVPARVALGTHVITAVYSGGGSYTGATSNAVAMTSNAAKVLPAVTLTVSANPVMTGQAHTLTATVNGSVPGVMPTGIVQIVHNGSITYQGPLNASGQLVYNRLAPDEAGPYPITANYLGDNNYLAATSQVLLLTVTPQ